MTMKKDLLLTGLVELSRGNDQAALDSFIRLLAGSEESTVAALCAALCIRHRLSGCRYLVL
jgi:hypothetical protein